MVLFTNIMSFVLSFGNPLATETQMESSAILTHTFDDALLELALLLTGKRIILLDPTEQQREGVCQRHRLKLSNRD
jgi:hypothetical protein